MTLGSLLDTATRIFGVKLAAPTRRDADDGVDPPLLTDAPLDVLAGKILYSHIRNKQQLLGPPPTALGHVDQHQAELLIRAAVAAATADGHLGEVEERKLRAALSSLAAQLSEPGFVSLAIKRPLPLEVLLRDVRDAHMASLFYAASLLALDTHNATNQAYLRYLAMRLRLPVTVLERLHSQYGVAIDATQADA